MAVNKYMKIFGDIVTFVSFFIIISGVIVFILLTSSVLVSKENYFIAAFVLSLCYVIGYFLAWSVNSILVAKRMEKRLKEKNDVTK
ncbi:hypothetical protein [Riemerella anatipestifer]|uniref:hypothetical protein n=1 Tax=Riemerella anatipestifer TaxID=34085 RepID=UPI00222E5DB5|nr:hypothetical protein [Riemerella anatipestifer]